MFTLPRTASAATFTVDSTGDTGDFSSADGVCDTNDSAGDGPCTLRAAIAQANATSGTDTVSFNIAGAGPHTITPNSALPAVTDPVIIDGTTEPDFAGTPIVELDGSAAGPGADGLSITSGDSLVRGLVINRFLGTGISLSGSGGNVIEGNFIGTDVTGMEGRGNFGIGVRILGVPDNIVGGSATQARNVISRNAAGIVITGSGATGNAVRGNYIGTDAAGSASLGNFGEGVVVLDAQANTIGGRTPGARNVISANDDAVNISGIESTDNVVQGNYLGTDATGTVAIPNNGYGVYLRDGQFNTIGGTASGAGNVISGNEAVGVGLLGSDAVGNAVQGNFIGTDASGSADLGNDDYGVWIMIGTDNIIGGAAPGARNVISGNDSFGIVISGSPAPRNAVRGNYIGTDATGASPMGNLLSGVRIAGATDGAIKNNVIAYNGGDGVLVESGAGNTISRNAIYSNAELGIDLGADGVTENDAGDPDDGANALQNFPVLVQAYEGSTTIDGSLNSTADTLFTIEFFHSESCDESGNGEGAAFLGSTVATTDASSDAAFVAIFTSTVPAGRFITSTATDPDGNTSEFSPCVPMLAGPQFTPTPTPTAQPEPGDTDGDGCSDQRELGSDETQGGLRSYTNPWDFYDVSGPGGVRDGYVDLTNDILGVVARYSPNPSLPYDPAYDRGPAILGPHPWDMTAPDGSISLTIDILGVILQYQHDCR